MTAIWKTLLSAVFLVALSGMVYIYPFNSYFRFTIAVGVLAILLLYFHRLPAITTSVLCGLAIGVGRSITQFGVDAGGLEDGLIYNYPAIFFYLAYGICFQSLGVRRWVNNVPVLILFLSVCDMTGNVVELIARADPLVSTGEDVLTRIASMAIFRSLVVVIGFYALRRYRALVLAEDQAARYAAMTVMIANLQAELYYLRKSSQNIEDVMEESYGLYQRLQKAEGDVATHALSIARNIHEVKKDYARVVTGIEAVLKPSVATGGMFLSEIFNLVEQNTQRYLAGSDKTLKVSFEGGQDVKTNQHYCLVSILDNLIINAIEACHEAGVINATGWIEEGKVVLVVEDNGCGIKAADMDIVFQPGFSTKYCPETGRMSTGLGLAHVRNLLVPLEGDIEVVSEIGVGTRFAITLPLNALEGG